MTDYKPGSRWKSGVCSGEFVLVKPPSGSGELTCGGAPLQLHGSDAAPAAATEAAGEGTLAGKRYADPDSGAEVLCTKPGTGSLGFAGRSLVRKDAKPLPASD